MPDQNPQNPSEKTDPSASEQKTDAAQITPGSSPTTAPRGGSRRQFLKGLVSAGAGLAATGGLLAGSEQTALANNQPRPTGAPGAPLSWQPSIGIYSGIVNLAVGNAQLTFPITSWSGKTGLSFSLVFNSQSTRSSALGLLWTYSYRMAIVGTSPAVVISDDGAETSFALSGGVYTPPTGCYDALVKNGDGSWTLTKKGGAKYNFRASDGMLTSIVDLNSNTISLTYSGSYLTTITDSVSRTIQLGYDGSNRLTSITDCQGRVWTLGYDANNRVNLISDPAVNGVVYTRSFGYDAGGHVNSHTDRIGKIWQYNFAIGGVLSGTTDPDSKTTSNSFQTTLTGSHPPTAVSYVQWTDSNGNQANYYLDNLGRHAGYKDAAGNLTQYSYDGSNNRTSTTLPSTLVWQTTFDTRGNPHIQQDPLGNQKTSVWGTFDKISSFTDESNHQTSYGYDANGNLTSILDANNGTTQHFYNADGTRYKTIDPANHVTQFGYDQWGHLSSSTVVKDVNTSFVTQWVYDKGSNLVSRTDPLSRLTNYSTDAWGRITGISYPTTGNPSISLVLDAESRLTQSTDSTGVRSYVYDSWSRRKSATDPRGNTTASYDPTGFLLNQTDVTQRLLSYTPNNLGQITKVTDGNDSTHADFTYTVDGQLQTATYPNGTKVTYGYDNAGRVNSIQHTLVSNGSTIIGYTATYYTNGWLHTITETPSGDVTTFTYDSNGNLLSEVRTGTKPYSETYTYYADNRRNTAVVVVNGVTIHNGTYTYDGAGRLIQVVDTATNPTTTENYTWNNDGTLASAPGSGYTKQFSYNEEQQLTSISHSGTLVYQYGYGADGKRRWSKDIANNLWTWYPCGVACDAGQLVEETSDLTGNTWTTSALYLRYGTGCSSALIRRNSEYHHLDVKGDFGVITGSTGAVTSSNVYGAYGVSFYTQGSRQSNIPSACRISGDEALVLSPGVNLPSRACSLVASQQPSLSPTCYAAPMGVVLSCLNACLKGGGAWMFCAGLCIALRKKGCEWLFLRCINLPEPQSDACMMVYLQLCLGE